MHTIIHSTWLLNYVTESRGTTYIETVKGLKLYVCMCVHVSLRRMGGEWGPRKWGIEKVHERIWCYLFSCPGREMSGEVEDLEWGIDRHCGICRSSPRGSTEPERLGNIRWRNERREGDREGMSALTSLAASFLQERQGRMRTSRK